MMHLHNEVVFIQIMTNEHKFNWDTNNEMRFKPFLKQFWKFV